MRNSLILRSTAFGFLALAAAGCTPAINLFDTRTPQKEPSEKDGPTVQVLVDHVTCELARAYKERRWASNRNVATASLWKFIGDDHFVAAVDLNLAVTHTEGLNPSLSFVTPLTAGGGSISPIITDPSKGIVTSAMFNRTLSLGAQLSGTQDNSFDVVYAIDLQRIVTGVDAEILANRMEHELTVLNGAAGVSPVDQMHSAQFFYAAALELDPGDASKLLASETLKDPPSPAQLREFVDAAQLVRDRLANMRPAYVTHCEDGEPSGIFEGLGGDLSLGTTVDDGLFALDASKEYNIYGSAGPSTEADASPNTFAALADLRLPSGGLFAAALAPGGGHGASKSSGTTTPSGGSSTATFAAKIDFTVLTGINGGEAWSLLRFKGPASGSSPLASLSRSRTDTLTITFSPTCRANHTIDLESAGKPEIPVSNFKDSVTVRFDAKKGLVDEYSSVIGVTLGTGTVISDPAGYLMISRNLDGAKHIAAVSWTGYLINDQVALTGTIMDEDTQRPVGLIKLSGTLHSKSVTAHRKTETTRSAVLKGTITSEALDALFGDGEVKSYWDTVPGCDTTTAAALQSIVNNAAAQTQFFKLTSSISGF